MIRTFTHPALVIEREEVRVLMITLRSPLHLRRLLWKIRRHPKIARKIGLEIVHYPR